MTGAGVVGRLRELAELRAAGALTEAEFAAAKGAILTEMAAAESPMRSTAPSAVPSPTNLTVPSSTAGPVRAAEPSTERRTWRSGLVVAVAVTSVVVLVITAIAWAPRLLGFGASAWPDGAVEPVRMGGVFDVWLVSGPGEPAPGTELPAEFTALLDDHDVEARVSVHSGDAFPDAYREVDGTETAPEILAGSNYLPLEEAFGTGEWPTVSTSGPIESVIGHRGFVNLPISADRHDATVQLALASPSCTVFGPTPRSVPDPAAVEAALGAIRVATEDPENVAPMIAADSLGFDAGDPAFRSQLHGLRSCAAAGNERIAVVQVSRVLSSDGYVGQSEAMVVLVPETDGWAVLAFASPSPELLAAADMAGTTADGVGGIVQLDLVAPAAGVEPVADAENFQNFDWTTTGDTREVLAEFLELAPGPSVFLVPTDRIGSQTRGRIGHSGFGATVGWRAWALLTDGSIVFSEVRSYQSP